MGMALPGPPGQRDHSTLKGTDTKQLAKDLHRPCVPHPFNDRNVRPTGDVPVPAEDEEMMSADMVPTGPPSVSWANLESIKKY